MLERRVVRGSPASLAKIHPIVPSPTFAFLGHKRVLFSYGNTTPEASMKILLQLADLAPTGGTFISAISTLSTRHCQVVRMSFHSYSGINRNDAPRSKNLAAATSFN